MTPQENLYYAVGELAYAVACADGLVQQEEREAFAKRISTAFGHNSAVANIPEIIFHIMSRQHTPVEDACEAALRELRQNSHYLSPALKETFCNIMAHVAEAYPPVTTEEEQIIARFFKEVSELAGDPAYYNDLR